jgi:hypothetical protein
MLENEADRSEDFFFQLSRIEYQAALIADNPNYNLDLEVTQNILQEKSTDLLAAVIRFLNSALVYFSSNFFGEPSIFF